MFSWWPKKADPKREADREAYIKRLYEVLENCTGSRHAGLTSQVMSLEPYLEDGSADGDKRPVRSLS